MRRIALTVLGVLEFAVAVVVVVLALQLPGQVAVDRGFDNIRNVTTGAASEVQLLREQLQELREHDFTRAARQLRTNAHAVATTLQDSRLDFRTIEALSTALGDVARGIEGWATTLDVERVKKLGDAMATAADFLERNVVESAAKAADNLEDSLTTLEKDALRLAELLKKAPPDLKALQDIHDGLARFDAGLEALGRVMKFERLGAMRDGFSGMETSLSTTAGEVDKLSGFTYPVVKLNGFRPPEVEMKPFWGEGPKIAEGLRKAVTGVKAANKQLEELDKELPALRTSLDASRKAIAGTRQSLGASLKQRSEVEKLLKSVPDQTAELAEKLPAIGRSFAQMLRKTDSLRDAAIALRQVRKLLDDARQQWPQLSQAMSRSAIVLLSAQKQLQEALAQREDYERALQSSAELAKVSADLLPVLTDRVDVRLGQQAHSLDRMSRGLNDLSVALPEVQRASGSLLDIFRWLLWLIAGLLALHSVFVVAGTIRKPSS